MEYCTVTNQFVKYSTLIEPILLIFRSNPGADINLSSHHNAKKAITDPM